MVSSRIAVLLALVIPVGARAATDEPEVTVDESAASSQPAPEPEPPPPVPPAARAAPPPVAGVPAPTSAQSVERPGTVDSVAPARAHPGTGIGVELGYARGGDRLVTRFYLDPPFGPTISAGEGVFVSLTGSWTPFWRESFGLGVYASAGVKYAGKSDSFGSVSFTRYPVAAAAQLLVPTSKGWFFLGRAGLLTEVGAKVSADGVGTAVNTDVAARWGGFADAGAQRPIGKHAVVTVFARYTYLDVSLGGTTTSANNLCAVLAFSFSR
jgi:hypothetical protein